MAKRTELVIHLATGEPRFPIWCDTCLTPAVVEVDVYILSEDGLGEGRTWRRCYRCHEDDDDA